MSDIRTLLKAVKRQPVSKERRGRRARQLRVPAGLSAELVVSLRQFRTDKSKRSKRQIQLVLPVYALPFKEIAVTKVQHRLTARQRRLKRSTDESLLWLRSRRAATLFVALGLGGALFFSPQLSTFRRLEPVAANSITASKTQTAKQPHRTIFPRSEPTRLRIPKINMDAAVVPVGLQADGSLAIPNSNLTGWYSQSPTPGERGAAVIVGHVDNQTGPAIFWRLRELQPGDVVEIDRADSRTVKFKVDEIKQFSQDNFPTQAVYGKVNYAGIRLITCGGVFNTQTQHYSDNTVVFGSLL